METPEPLAAAGRWEQSQDKTTDALSISSDREKDQIGEVLAIARAVEVAETLRSKYVGRVRPDAPAWAFTVFHVGETATAQRVRWDGPLFPLMPYRLHKTVDANFRCIVGRRYRPIGYAGRGQTDYEMASYAHISKSEFEVLRAAGVVDARGYLHNDSTSPRRGSYELSNYRRKLLAMLAPYIAQGVR
jgi:hypothetical protein